MEKDWSRYFQAVGDVPNSFTDNVLSLSGLVRGTALDLGAGNMRDAKRLLANGFRKVVAVDPGSMSKDFVVEGIELHTLPAQLFQIQPESYDLVISFNTLFFLSPAEIEKLCRDVYAGLREGGFFACNILAPEDGWNGRPGSYSLTFEEVEAFFLPFKRKEIGEMKRYGSDALLFSKLWHQWTVIVQK